MELDVRIDAGAAVGLTVAADRVVMLEREAERIHLRMAARAHGVVAMLLHPLAQRGRLPRGSFSFSGGTFGGGGGGGAPSRTSRIQ